MFLLWIILGIIIGIVIGGGFMVWLLKDAMPTRFM
jgi:hypothetical protein